MPRYTSAQYNSTHHLTASNSFFAPNLLFLPDFWWTAFTLLDLSYISIFLVLKNFPVTNLPYFTQKSLSCSILNVLTQYMYNFLCSWVRLLRIYWIVWKTCHSFGSVWEYFENILTDSGVDLTATNSDGETILHLACQCADKLDLFLFVSLLDEELVRKLVDLPDAVGRTPLYQAAKSG